MRLGWSIPIVGPIRLSGTIWRSKPKRKWKTLSCGHAHRSQAAYDRCLQRSGQL